MSCLSPYTNTNTSMLYSNYTTYLGIAPTVTHWEGVMNAA
jgi:hypothetical protein